jgi:hypothetical protein
MIKLIWKNNGIPYAVGELESDEQLTFETIIEKIRIICDEESIELPKCLIYHGGMHHKSIP